MMNEPRVICRIQASTALRGLCVAVCLLSSAVASAGEFHVRYDADVYPERDGWSRYGQDPEDALRRELHDGLLEIDTRGSQLIFDLYEFYSDELEPAPGQQLRVDWRVRTLEGRSDRGASEVSMFVANRDDAYVQVKIGTDHVAESLYVFGYEEYLAPIDPAIPHTYSILTSDMRSYEFRIDDVVAWSGEFHWLGLRDGPVVSFGDSAYGYPNSLAEWDFVAISVVPEPSALATLLILSCTAHAIASRSHRS